jgi:hypothetical protein
VVPRSTLPANHRPGGLNSHGHHPHLDPVLPAGRHRDRLPADDRRHHLRADHAEISSAPTSPRRSTTSPAGRTRPNFIETKDAATRVRPKLAGAVTLEDSSITFNGSSNGTDARTVFTLDQAGFILMADAGLGTGKKAEVFPVSVGSVVKVRSLDSDLQDPRRLRCHQHPEDRRPSVSLRDLIEAKQRRTATWPLLVGNPSAAAAEVKTLREGAGGASGGCSPSEEGRPGSVRRRPTPSARRSCARPQGGAGAGNATMTSRSSCSRCPTTSGKRLFGDLEPDEDGENFDLTSILRRCWPRRARTRSCRTPTGGPSSWRAGVDRRRQGRLSSTLLKLNVFAPRFEALGKG